MVDAVAIGIGDDMNHPFAGIDLGAGVYHVSPAGAFVRGPKFMVGDNHLLGDNQTDHQLPK